mmetsp:Transcript_32537/g.44597  ORF Transcript_32537/g.44597 Transcript_32537/m.44597 type:complete len:152 (-) Transcript_32537:5-460(-)
MFEIHRILQMGNPSEDLSFVENMTSFEDNSDDDFTLASEERSEEESDESNDSIIATTEDTADDQEKQSLLVTTSNNNDDGSNNIQASVAKISNKRGRPPVKGTTAKKGRPPKLTAASKLPGDKTFPVNDWSLTVTKTKSDISVVAFTGIRK